MLLFIVGIIAIFFYYFVFRKNTNWLKYGEKHRYKEVKVLGRKYIVEQISFSSAKESAHYIYPIIHQFLDRKEIVATKYDWYDWSFNIIEYQDITIGLYRKNKTIYLVSSTFKISLEEFESIFVGNNWDYKYFFVLDEK